MSGKLRFLNGFLICINMSIEVIKVIKINLFDNYFFSIYCLVGIFLGVLEYW